MISESSITIVFFPIFAWNRPDCLMICRHPDIVSGVAFHPLNDRYFLTGCLDKKLRVWDMDSGTPIVSAWAQTPEMISSVCYYSNGSMAVAGLINGVVFLFDASNKMKYYTQILCRNRSGKYRQGCKISGVQHIPSDSLVNISAHAGGNTNTNSTTQSNRIEHAQLLVSSNDSRIRMFRLNDFSLRSKFKGHSTSTNLPIRASISECGAFIISGSEQGTVYIWQKSYGRRKVKSTDAYTNGGDGAAYMTNLRSGLNILRNSECESFDNNVELSPHGHAQAVGAESARTFNPTLCTCFGTSNLVKNVLPESKICELLAESRLGFSAVSSTVSGDFSASIDIISGPASKTLLVGDQPSNSKFINKLAHNIIITADYNGAVRVFVKGF